MSVQRDAGGGRHRGPGRCLRAESGGAGAGGEGRVGERRQRPGQLRVEGPQGPAREERRPQVPPGLPAHVCGATATPCRLHRPRTAPRVATVSAPPPPSGKT